ncbi:MAG: ATP-dependent DNA helicase, partial [Polyangia bacterium]|nr:ATP-dependent DNA helicase [Polyangia bacterium]
MSVDSIFSETGPLARAIPGYRPRAGQLLMAHTVEGALSREEVLAVEAPCGVGKSLAYLIPAITLAVERNQRVIVSTGMISLQEQLLGKDLPMLRDALPYDFTFALAKGKSNFLCRHRLAEPDELLVNSQENAEHLERLLQWAEATVTGDKAHVTDPEGKPWSPPEEVWAMVTSGSDECLGKACPHREGCFYEAAKRRWKTARIVVCNHHLLVLDLLMGGIILGEAGAVIVDEAHRLPDSARGALGYEVGFGSVARLAARVAAEGHEEAADDLRAEGRAFFEQLTAYRLTPKTYKARIRVPGVVDTQPLLSALGWAREKLRAEEASIDTSDPCCDDDEKERRALLHKLAERCGDISERIHNAISLVDPQQIV